MIHVDGIGGGTITHDVTLEAWAGVKIRAVSDIEPCPVIGGLDVTLYDADRRPLATTNVQGAGGYLFPRLPLGTYYVSANDPRGVYRGEAFEDVATPDAATPLVLTRASSKAAIVMHLTPIRGVTPDFGALPDGSTTTASLRLGISSQAVASSGDTTLICGAGAGSERGCYVYQRGDAGWARRDLLTFPSTRGSAVDVDGDLAAVCGMDGPDHALVNGKLYVYRRQGGVWTLEATLRPEPDDFSLGFGSSVAVSGETIIVGAPQAYVGYTRAAGVAYVYVHTAGGWTQQARIAGDAVRDRRFGAHVALDGDRALVATGDETGIRSRCTSARPGAGTRRWPRRPLLALLRRAVRRLRGAAGRPRARRRARSRHRGRHRLRVRQARHRLEHERRAHRRRRPARRPLRRGRGPPGRRGPGRRARQGLRRVPDPDGGAYLFRDDGGVWRQDAEMEPVRGQSPALFGSCLALAGRDLFVGSPGELRADGQTGRVHVFSPYVTNMDTALTADAGHGVLVNDIGPEGLALTAELGGAPEHGSVELGVDGSFVYTPSAAYVGTDQFTYRAVSGDWQSDSATVTITLRGLSGPSLARRASPPAGSRRRRPSSSRPPRRAASPPSSTAAATPPCGTATTPPSP